MEPTVGFAVLFQTLRNKSMKENILDSQESFGSITFIQRKSIKNNIQQIRMQMVKVGHMTTFFRERYNYT